MVNKKIPWGSTHPGHLVYLVDLSQSMGQDGKIDNVIETIRQVSEYLVSMSEEGTELRNRFSISIYGYNSNVVTLFRGSVIDLDKKLEEQSNKRLPLFDKEKEAKPQWQTYTEKGFQAVAEDIKQWISQQQKNNILMPVPIVIHITDGYPYEHERRPEQARDAALKAAKELMEISVPDGNVLLFNIHIGEGTQESLTFPNSQPKDEDRKFLYEASSIMTEDIVTRAKSFKLPAKEGSRFMVSNETDQQALAKLVAFGSSIKDEKAEEEPLL